MMAADVLGNQCNGRNKDTGEQDQDGADPWPCVVNPGSKAKHTIDLVQPHVNDHCQHQHETGGEGKPTEVAFDQRSDPRAKQGK